MAEAPLDRAALLMAAARAASSAALGQDDAEQRRRLDGKRFEVRIRFGCGGEAQVQDGKAAFAVRFDEVDRMLRLRAAPDLNLDDPVVASIGGKKVEAVEGFWLRRPWLLGEGCPALPAAEGEAAKAVAEEGSKEPGAPPAQGYRVGIAEFFSSSDSRTARRDGRAYEAAKELGGVQQPSKSGYNLVLSGRLRQLPSGRVISCVAADPDQPPECVISAQFDRVRIESPGTREILADWSR